MDQLLHSDVWMHILSYVNVVDAYNDLQLVSKRMYYLVANFRGHPQLAAASTPVACLKQLTHKPNLVMEFRSNRLDPPKCVPPEAILLGAHASDVQSNIEGEVTTDDSIIMASFSPNTVITPFVNELPQDDEEYDVMIVYACGHGSYGAQQFLSAFQSRHPTATIVGGVCEGGYVSDFNTPSGIRRIQSGIFGIVGRNMPLKTVVSRGVKSLTDDNPWTVHEVRLVTPDDGEYIFVGHEDPYHNITEIASVESGVVTSPTALLRRHEPDFCGIQREGEDGFELHALNPISLQTNSIILMTDGSREQCESLQNAQLDLFDLDGEECKRHVDWTLSKLKHQTQEETVLGAIMFSCNGRGPDARSLLRERMADASRFERHFSKVPCCGFYAGGEIGPLALAGQHGNVFQRGKAAIQGFTVVFALFIVPPPQAFPYELNDSPENVAAFVRNRLGV